MKNRRRQPPRLLPLVLCSAFAWQGTAWKQALPAAEAGKVQPRLSSRSRGAEVPSSLRNRTLYYSAVLQSESSAVRSAALKDLNLVHDQVPLVAALVEPLAQNLGDPATCRDAAVLLGKLGEPAVECLDPHLDNPNRLVRVTAAESLLRILWQSTLIPSHRDLEEDYLLAARQRAMATMLEALANPDCPEWEKAALAASYYPRAERFRAVEPLLTTLLSPDHPRRRRTAADALARLGVPGLAPLAVAAEHGDDQVRASVAHAISYYAGDRSSEEARRAILPVAERLSIDANLGIAQEAAQARVSLEASLVQRHWDALRRSRTSTAEAELVRSLLTQMGIKAASDDDAIPQLLKLLASEEKGDLAALMARHQALQVLVFMGERGRPHLLDLLKNGNRTARLATIGAIGELLRDWQEPIPLLIEALDEDDKTLREAAVRALGHMRPNRPEWLDPLTKLLDENDPGAPAVLARYGPQLAAQVIERIRKADDPTAELAIAVFSAFENPPDDMHIRELIELSTNGDEHVQHRARRALTGTWRFTRPQLMEAVHSHADPNVRIRLVGTISFDRIQSAPAVPALLKALDDPERDVRLAAASCLARISPGVARWSPAMRGLVPEIVEAALEKDRLGSQQFQDTLRAFGDLANAAIPVLSGHLENPVAARFVQERGEAAVPALRKALTGDSAPRRSAALAVLTDMGKAGKYAAPDLIKLAECGSAEEQLLAARALAAIGTAPEVALNTVRRAIRDKNPKYYASHSLEVLIALSAIHQPAADELGALLTATGSKRLTTFHYGLKSESNLKALGRAAPKSPAIAQALQQLALENANEAAFAALVRVSPLAAAKIADQYYAQLAIIKTRNPGGRAGPRTP